MQIIKSKMKEADSQKLSIKEFNNRNKSELINGPQTALLIIDMQEKIIPQIRNRQSLINNIIKLIKGCKIIGLRLLHTEQNPSKLGKTIESIENLLSSCPYTKMTFSCCGSDEFLKEINKNGQIENIVICGIESHICILQSALELTSKGFNVFVPRDAVNSRNDLDHETAISRLSSSNITITTVESIIFELCQTAKRNEFKSISKLIKEA